MKEQDNPLETDSPSQPPAAQAHERQPDASPKNSCCRDLEALKNELDSFLYAVSHDVGAPIRAVQGFSFILLEHYADALDDEGRDYLARIHAASRKLDEMVNGLLQISRLARAAIAIEEVDLGAIAKTIAERFAGSAPERNVRFILAENIRALGDRAQLTVVLEHLLDNAWKFTSHNEIAVIEFGVEVTKGERAYFVRDNGVGFSMVHAENRLFKPFQKLHNARDYPGSGIGLATVDRIIRRAGGRVWFESEEKKGTTIFFTLE